MIAKRKKLLIIVLEGATDSIITRMINENKLIFFSRIKSLGLSGKLNSGYSANRASSWATLLTGKNPGKHGIYDFLDHRHDPLNPDVKGCDSINTRLLWDFTNEVGLKTIFFNIPIAKYPEPVNGVMVSGFLTPEGEKTTYPDFLNDKINTENFIPDVCFPKNKKDEAYFDNAINSLKSQFSIFRNLIQDREWDLALFSTNVLERLQSTYWNDCEKIESTYQTLDTLLGSLEILLSPDVHIIVLSNFSYKPVTKKFFVNEWLWEHQLQQRKISTQKNFISNIEEYLNLHTNGNGRIIPDLLAKSGITKSNIRSILPNAMSEILNKAIPRTIKRLFHSEYINIIWDQSTSFFLSSNFPGIRLNVKGREPFGIIDGDSEYERTREQIISDLLHLKDPYTFEHVFIDVFKREEVFSGKYLEDAPDIILVPRKNIYYLHPQKRTSRLSIGSANDEKPIFVQQDPTGIFYMKFPEYATVGKVPTINLSDLLPTILAFYEIHANDDFDGKVRKELIGENEIVTETIQPLEHVSAKPNAQISEQAL